MTPVLPVKQLYYARREHPAIANLREQAQLEIAILDYIKEKSSATTLQISRALKIQEYRVTAILKAYQRIDVVTCQNRRWRLVPIEYMKGCCE